MLTRKAADRRGFLLLSVSALALAAAGSTMVLTKPPKRDLATFCQTSGKVRTHQVVIVDQTDRWNAARSTLLHDHLHALARDAAVDDRLTLIPFTGSAEEPDTPSFDRCKSIDPRTVNPLFTTPEHAEKQYRATFADPLEAALPALVTAHDANETNLVAFLANVAARLKTHVPADETIIIIYSDLAENTKDFSMARSTSRFSAEGFHRYFAQHVNDKLAGFRLEINYMPTEATPPDRAQRVKAAWVHALKRMNIDHVIKEL